MKPFDEWTLNITKEDFQPKEYTVTATASNLYIFVVIEKAKGTKTFQVTSKFE